MAAITDKVLNNMMYHIEKYGANGNQEEDVRFEEIQVMFREALSNPSVTSTAEILRALFMSTEQTKVYYVQYFDFVQFLKTIICLFRENCFHRRLLFLDWGIFCWDLI